METVTKGEKLIVQYLLGQLPDQMLDQCESEFFGNEEKNTSRSLKMC
jgi:hypothetical protein